MRTTHLVALVALAGLTACSSGGRDITLHNLKSYNGQPEEFSIAPVKPLVQPENYSELPTPTPGAGNRTDQNPKADAVAALGGNPARLDASGGVPSSDTAIISRASRYGRDGNVRQTLASEDLEHRKRKSLFTWSIVPEDNYNRAYKRQSLDPYSWLFRYRKAGAQTPAAPPPG
ncbi:DUF3035 domain-containing protein [uncultured Pelagimonas sp.]|uniref:DUF3035 domain-containing protein n=1 Tax=uncultured Pelagimonas sp. TaxID=1618102 RepID=UPI00260E82F1|nr:DUF3035 domain-containing protein [uncultured Pelagimonas sp.]